MIRIALIPGDGIGPEVVREGRRVIEAVVAAGLVDATVEEFPHGADHLLATGETLNDETFRRLRDEFDSILLGAVGDPRVPDNRHARDILLGLRFRLDLFINFRPARVRLAALSPLKDAELEAARHRSVPGEHGGHVYRRRREFCGKGHLMKWRSANRSRLASESSGSFGRHSNTLEIGDVRE